MKQHCTFFQMCGGGNDKLVFSPIFKRKVPMCAACAEKFEETPAPAASVPVVKRTRASRAFADDK